MDLFENNNFSKNNRIKTVEFQNDSKVLGVSYSIFGILLILGAILLYLIDTFDENILLNEFINRFWIVLRENILGVFLLISGGLLLFFIYTKSIISFIINQSEFLYFDRYEIYINRVPLALVGSSVFLMVFRLNTIVAVIYMSCAFCLIRYGLIKSKLSISTIFDFERNTIRMNMCYTPVLIKEYCMDVDITRNQNGKFQYAVLTNHKAPLPLSSGNLGGKSLRYMKKSEYLQYLEDRMKSMYLLQIVHGSIISNSKIRNQAIGVTVYKTYNIIELQSVINQLQENYEFEYCNVEI